MKHKILERIAPILSMGSLGYILGQAGRLENDMLSFEGFFARGGIGIAVLGIGVLLINYLGKEKQSCVEETNTEKEVTEVTEIRM